MEDVVYPISQDKSQFFIGEKCTIYSLKKLTEYYDFKDREYKYQSTIRLTLKISSSKLDEFGKEEQSKIWGLFLNSIAYRL